MAVARTKVRVKWFKNVPDVARLNLRIVKFKRLPAFAPLEPVPYIHGVREAIQAWKVENLS